MNASPHHSHLQMREGGSSIGEAIGKDPNTGVRTGGLEAGKLTNRVESFWKTILTLSMLSKFFSYDLNSTTNHTSNCISDVVKYLLKIPKNKVNK